METIAEETVESPNIGDAGVIAGSCDSHVTNPEGSCDLQSSLLPRGSTCDVGDDQSYHGSVTSSGTLSVKGEEGGAGGKELRGKTLLGTQSLHQNYNEEVTQINTHSLTHTHTHTHTLTE